MTRLPIIRHVRWWLLKRRVDAHYRMWRTFGMLPVNRASDDAVLNKIWRGEQVK